MKEKTKIKTKKAYNSPKLTIYGNVSKLTLGSGSGVADGASGQVGMLEF